VTDISPDNQQPHVVNPSTASLGEEVPLVTRVLKFRTISARGRFLVSRTFYTLRYREFRLFWMALVVSLLGVSFQTVAQSWLVYRLTNSPLMLGVTGFIPALVAAPASVLGGLLADRVSRRNLVIITQTLMMIPPVVLAYLIWRNQVQPWHVIAATAVLAIVAAVDLPSRTSMVPQLVPADDLLNAQGLASAVGQVTRIIGPALAGLIVALWGEAVPYLINGLTYLAMVVALLMMNPIPPVERDRREGVRSSLLGGFRYTLRTPIVFGLFLTVAAQGFFLSAYVTLLPVFAKDILNVGARGLGWLNAAAGAGALLGALGVANLQTGRRGWVLNFGGFIMPAVLVAFAWSGNFYASVPLLLLLGAGTVIIRTIAATFLLTIVPDSLRGRVISLATMIFYGAPYAAGLPVGYFAERWGTPIVLSLCAPLFLASLLWVYWKMPEIRRRA